jgi:tetratricopeptide (TPR) repeat protein
LCSIAYLQGDLEASEDFAAEALERARLFGDKYALAIALVNRAQVAIAGNELDAAIRFGEEALAVSNELGNREFAAEALRHQAMAYLKAGDTSRARLLFQETLGIVQGLGAKRQLTWALEGLAQCLAAEGEWGKSARVFAAGSALRTRIAIPKDAFEIAEHAKLLDTLRAELGISDFERAWSQGANAELGELVSALLAEPSGRE